MNRFLAKCFLLSLAAWQLSMARGAEEKAFRVELAENPFLPIAGLLVASDQGVLQATVLSDTVLSDAPEALEGVVAQGYETCDQGQSIRIESKKLQIPVANKSFYRVCLRPKGELAWQTFSFLGGKAPVIKYSISAVEGLPEKESSKRILKMFLPFESAKAVHVGIGKDSRCHEDMAVVDPNSIFSYDLAKLGGKSSEVFLCISATKQDGSTLSVLHYNFKYSCTSRSGECQGSGLGREADVKLALQSLSPDESQDRNEALESWMALGYADADQAKFLEKTIRPNLQESISAVTYR